LTNTDKPPNNDKHNPCQQRKKCCCPRNGGQDSPCSLPQRTARIQRSRISVCRCACERWVAAIPVSSQTCYFRYLLAFFCHSAMPDRAACLEIVHVSHWLID
jgi:hypothetical protein